VKVRFALFVSLVATSLLLPLGSSASATAGDEPVILTGKVLDTASRPVANVLVTARVERDTATGTIGTKVAEATSDATGAFTLAGDLSAPASSNPDGSVRLEITTITPEAAEHRLINVFPPTATAPWTWAEPDLTVVSGAPVVEDLMRAPLTGVILKFASGEPVSLNASSQITSPSAIAESDLSAEDQADLEADKLAKQTGTSTAVEAGYAAVAKECSDLNSRTWDNTTETKSRWTPLHYSWIRTKFMHEFAWDNSSQSTFQVAYAGVGKNYAGGLSYSMQSSNSAGWSDIRGDAGAKDKRETWKLEWEYVKQREHCFDLGYGGYTGKTRWVPKRRLSGSDLVPDANVLPCTGTNDAYLETSLWVARSTSSTFGGYFQIAGVSLSASQTRSSSHKATYILRPERNHGWLCGNDEDPIYAHFVFEVPDR